MCLGERVEEADNQIKKADEIACHLPCHFHVIALPSLANHTSFGNTMKIDTFANVFARFCDPMVFVYIVDYSM